MSAILPINLDDLLHCRGVESERVEFKASWDPETTGLQVLRTICAFANDYHNLNGGYMVIGVAEGTVEPYCHRLDFPPRKSRQHSNGFAATATDSILPTPHPVARNGRGSSCERGLSAHADHGTSQ